MTPPARPLTALLTALPVPAMSRSRTAALLLAAVLPLAACGGGDASTGADAVSAAAPAVIEHALGTTEVPADAERVVTWGWGSADAAVALGVVPVAMPFQAYAGDADGVLPWLRTAVEEQGAELPAVLPDQQEVPVEAIAAADPDVILAPYSGLTQTEYDQLSRIAPTVAYPEEPWATPWRDTVRIVGEALGRAEEAEQLLADIDGEVAEQAAAHPELQGKTVAQVWSTPDALYVYKPADPRVQFTEDLGLTTSPAVQELASGGESFYYTLARERLAELEADVVVTYADSPQASQAFLASPEAELLPAAQRGAVAEVVGTELISAVSPPTALSLTYGLEDYVSALAEAAARA